MKGRAPTGLCIVSALLGLVGLGLGVLMGVAIGSDPAGFEESVRQGGGPYLGSWWIAPMIGLMALIPLATSAAWMGMQQRAPAWVKWAAAISNLIWFPIGSVIGALMISVILSQEHQQNPA